MRGAITVRDLRASNDLIKDGAVISVEKWNDKIFFYLATGYAVEIDVSLLVEEAVIEKLKK